MAISLQEAFYFVQDVWQYVNVNLERRSLRQPGRGTDYSSETQGGSTIVSGIHPKRMHMRVTGINQGTKSSKTFSFERLDGPIPPFRPGQYINLFLDVDGVMTSRPYSIASSPGAQTLELTVRDNPGGFVAPYILNELLIGDEIVTTGPEGHFYHEPLTDGRDLVFLAGGSGITPFMSMIRYFLTTDAPQPPPDITLIYGSRMADDIIYNDELTRLSADYPNFKYVSVISEPPPGFNGVAGLLDASLISRLVPNIEGKTFYICGPNAMYDLCLGALIKLGIPRYRIKRELYGPPEDITSLPGWPAEVRPENIFDIAIAGFKQIRAPAGEPLMNSLERYGIVVPAICRVGECSACRVRLLKGKVFMPPQTGIRESDRDFGYIHACVSYPLEDLQIRI